MNYFNKIHSTVSKGLLLFGMILLLATTTNAQRIAVVDVNKILENIDEYRQKIFFKAL